MFVDQVKIYAKGGNGGNGCVSFRREKFIPKGGPDGGDGGNGGNVVLLACSSEQSLVHLRYNQHCKAKNGLPGQGKQKNGASSNDVIIKVPLGTLVKKTTDKNHIIVDLKEEGDSFIAAKGGKGGKGNLRYLSSVNRAPRQFEEGEFGEEEEYFLELKIIADIGLVGYPNAGKSSLLNTVSQANPKIGSYPFTTISPNIGVVYQENFLRYTIADIPGLIDGASNNVGLGHNFLRHVERTLMLVLVIDIAEKDKDTPYNNMMSLINELELYQEGLSKKIKLVIANKIDEDNAEENLAYFKEKCPFKVIAISAILEENIPLLLKTLSTLFIQLKQKPQEENKQKNNIDLSQEDSDFESYIEGYNNLENNQGYDNMFYV